MKNIQILLIILLSYSCNNNQSIKIETNNKPGRITNVKNLSSNAFVFTELDNNRLYIIPVEEKDSTIFKSMNVTNAIEGRISIQLNIGCFSNFYNDVNKKIITHKACNLPFDSMYYSRAYIQYKNYSEILMHPTDANGMSFKLRKEDSCNTKLISESDSSSFDILYIYSH